jgi:hypothetical protein
VKGHALSVAHVAVHPRKPVIVRSTATARCLTLSMTRLCCDLGIAYRAQKQ